MSQKLTILFDLDGTLVNTAPDLMHAHNYVMKKYGYNIYFLCDLYKYCSLCFVIIFRPYFSIIC